MEPHDHHHQHEHGHDHHGGHHHGPGHNCAHTHQQLAEFKKLAEQNLEGWQRAKADYANLKKDVEKQQVEFARFAHATLVEALLPAIDNLDRAMEHIPEAQRSEGWVQGIIGTHKQLKDILASVGVAEVPTDGAFDPELHEAVSHEVAKGKESGAILTVSQKGYTLNGTLIRPAHVKVAK